MSSWEELIIFINKLNNDDIFTKKDIINYFIMDYNSLSNYINYLRQAKFIIRIKKGQYQKNKNIPQNITIKKIRELIYPYGKTQKEREILINRYWKIIELKNIINDR